MNQEQIPTLQQQLRTAHQVVVDSIEGIGDEEARKIPDEGEWTVTQLLAHIAEIQYFWMAKAVSIIKEDDPNITRSDVENDRRVAAVADHAGDPLDDLIRDVAAANESAIAATGEIAPEDLATPGRRGEDNTITVEGVIQFLATHMETHALQITTSRQLISEAGSRG